MLAKLKNCGIPTESANKAVQFVMNDDVVENGGRAAFGVRSQEEYETLIGELLEEPVPADKFTNAKEARLFFGYLVQESILNYQSGGMLTTAGIRGRAEKKYVAYVEDNPWSIIEYSTYTQSTAPKLDAAGNVKPKKGAKKDLANKVYNDNKDKTMSRKEWIELLCAEVGLTAAGASTYYAALKKGAL